MTKSKLLSKTFKVVVYDPDTETYSFANRKPHKYHKYTYSLSLMFYDSDKGYTQRIPEKVTLLEGATMLVETLRKENRLIRADLKAFSKNGGDTDTKHYRGRFKYRMDHAQDPADTTINEFLARNDKNIKYWSSVIKTIKTTPEYLVYVLTK